MELLEKRRRERKELSPRIHHQPSLGTESQRSEISSPRLSRNRGPMNLSPRGYTIDDSDQRKTLSPNSDLSARFSKISPISSNHEPIDRRNSLNSQHLSPSQQKPNFSPNRLPPSSQQQRSSIGSTTPRSTSNQSNPSFESAIGSQMKELFEERLGSMMKVRVQMKDVYQKQVSIFNFIDAYLFHNQSIDIVLNFKMNNTIIFSSIIG